MKIIEYDPQYEEDVKDLLVTLQKYIVALDREHYNIITADFRERYFTQTIKEVMKAEGKILLAVEEEDVVGGIVGLINNDEIESYDFHAPKRGRVSELVVKETCRGKGIGRMLLQAMEKYFKSVGCEGCLIAVFGYNEGAQKFYQEQGYGCRNIEVMKKL